MKCVRRSCLLISNAFIIDLLCYDKIQIPLNKNPAKCVGLAQIGLHHHSIEN
jgi:hypothetical protein